MQILTPRLLIKYHKTILRNGSFPTRMLVPATNFTHWLAKIAYIAIKQVLDSHNIKYNKRTIVQWIHLKCQLEELKLKAGRHTITSLDIINIYPWIKFKLIRQAICHYSEGCSEEKSEVIESALEILPFSMKNTRMTFRSKYYEHGKEQDRMNRPLVIGRYESACDANLVASYLL